MTEANTTTGHDENSTPFNIIQAAEELRKNLLPEKSRYRYEKAYESFMEWKKSKNIQSVSENVLLVYFGEIAKKFKPPTLWSTYSMLRSTLNINDNIHIEKYKQLMAFMKKQSKGYESKKSKVLSANEVKKFLDEAPDKEYLAVKVALIFGINGACRTAELLKLTTDDIINKEDIMIVKLKDTKTKATRTFTIDGDFMEKVKAYMNLRPPNSTSNRFFCNYKNGKCTNQFIGKNKLGSMPQDIAKYLNLPDAKLYTGHAFRRTSATIYADEGAHITEIKRLGGWKSTSVAEGYIEESEGYKRRTTRRISAAIASTSKSTPKIGEEGKEEKEDGGEEAPSILQENPKTNTVFNENQDFNNLDVRDRRVMLNLSNCSNVNIHLHNI